MITTYKFRAYPYPSQKSTMDTTLETCRRLYNNAVADRIENRSTFYQQEKALVQSKTKYQKAVHSQVLLDTLFRVDKTFKAFFNGLAEFPKFRRSGHYNSFSYPQSGFKLNGSRIYLSKIGKVRIRLHRKIEGAIKRVTVIRDIDQWFVAFTVENEEDAIMKIQNPKTTGVDVGVLNSIALSDGSTVENPRHLKQNADRIKNLQRQLSRKKKGSRNRDKVRTALAKTWRKVRHQRDDFAHKISHKLATDNGTIVFEDLKLRNMVKNHNLASAILDATWGKLRLLTAYKAKRRGGRVLLVQPNGTSQKCSGCDMVSPIRLTLNDRVFRCEYCGLVLDRDINAARNILKMGLERSLVETEPLLIRHISKFQSRKQEAHGFIRGQFTKVIIIAASTISKLKE